MNFIGEYSAKIDDKGRIILPSAFKSLLPADDMRFVVRKDIFDDCLEMLTFSEWEKRSEQIKSRLNFLKKEHAAFWREFMRGNTVVTPDNKLGRISIPRKLLDAIGAEKEVIFAGNDHKIELWAREKYESSAIPEEEFVSLAEIVSNL